MGRVPRFVFTSDYSRFSVGVGVCRSPYSCVAGICLGFWDISYGFGKAYEAM